MSQGQKLTGKQDAFVNAYLMTSNATESARMAGYKGDENTLSSVGYENLRKPDIQAAIKERIKGVKMDVDEALGHLAVIARAGAKDSDRINALKTIIQHHDGKEGGDRDVQTLVRALANHLVANMGWPADRALKAAEAKYVLNAQNP